MTDPDPTKFRPVAQNESRDSTVVKFEDFEFSNVEWQDSTIPNLSIPIKQASIQLNVGGAIYAMRLSSWERISPNNSSASLFVNFFIKEVGQGQDAESLLEGSIIFKFNNSDYDGENTVLTAIGKDKDNKRKKLPKGFGISFFEKILNFIQYKVRFYHSNFLHVITPQPYFGFTKQKWDEVFSHFLTERGYVKNTDHPTEGLEEDWRKEYKA